MQDMGLQVQLRCFTDSDAAKGIALRRGVGKVKHLEVKTLWVQDLIERKKLSIHKVDGRKNPADMMTKYLEGARIQVLCRMMSLTQYEGRDPLAPELQGE